MSQWDVYEAIQSLGGRATFAQIRTHMQNKHHACPDSSMHSALQKLICNGLVTSAAVQSSMGRRTYCIAGEFPERNVIVVKNGI